MKKKYEKPMIIIENFSLSTIIAGDCEGNPVGNPARGTCAVEASGNIKIFTDEMTKVCDYTPGSFGQPEDTWDGFCYHVPVDTANLFNS